MTPKDLLTIVASPREEGAFAASECLARMWGAHVTALQLVQFPDAMTAASPFAGGLWAQLLETTRSNAETDRAKIAQRLATLAVDVRSDEGDIATLTQAVALKARHASLTIVQRPDGSLAEAAFEAALFNSGRPVLVVPPDWKGAVIGARTMIAWSATREAARALSDATPFLEAAKAITVVAVDASPVYAGDTDAGVDIRTHLSRQGLQATLRQRDSFGKTAQAALLDEARDLDADLIVMGGYGHSRLREFVWSGVTRALTLTAPIPILISH